MEDSSEMITRVLFAGACNGNLGKLFNKVAKINDKNGPFDALFCVGNFFPQADSKEDRSEESTPVLDFIKGEEDAPLDTYFIGNFGKGSLHCLDSIGEGKNRMKYLGKSGVVKIKGLSVAFLDGLYDSKKYRSKEEGGNWYYTREEVDALKQQVKEWQCDIDLFLTCEWPHGILNGVANNIKEGLPGISGSPAVSDLAELIRPRYHIVCDTPVHFIRNPYINPSLGAGEHVTRFISLAPVATPQQKFLHALQLIPAESMTPKDVHTIPPDADPSPYANKAGKRGFEDAMDTEWGQTKRLKAVEPSTGNPEVVKDRRKTCYVRGLSGDLTLPALDEFFSQAGKVTSIYRTANEGGRIKPWALLQFDTVEEMQTACKTLHNSTLNGSTITVEPAAKNPVKKANPDKPVDGCWFCLGSVSSDKSLVASVGSECYIALDKGPITDDHVLIVPTKHYSNTLSMSESCYEEVLRYLSALTSFFAASGRCLIAFERFLHLRKFGGNHCIISIISIPKDKEDSAKEVFMSMCQKHRLTLTWLPPEESLDREAMQELVGDEEYFMALLPDRSRLVRRTSRHERLPVTFGREVFANLVGKEDRTNWKACVGTPEDEKARVEKFRSKFGQYDIMNTQNEEENGNEDVE